MSFVYDKNYFKKHFSGRGIGGFLYRKYIDTRNKTIKNEILKIIKKGNFLDIGFGDDNLIKLFKNDFEVFGLDISEYAVKEIQKKYKKENFKICDISKEEIPFKEKFDVICAINTIEHLSNLNDVFKKIYKATKKGGLFVIYLPTKSNLLSKFQYKVLYDVKEHTFRPSNKDLKKMIQKSRFRLIKEYSGNFFPLKIKTRAIIDSFCLYFGIFQK